MPLRRKRAIVAAAAAVCAVSTACSPSLEMTTASVPDASQAVVNGQFLGQQEVDFRSALVMQSEQGRLTSVAIVDPEGNSIPGELRNGGTEWHVPPRSLQMATDYTVTAAAVDRYGTATQTESAFTTMLPSNVNDYSFSLSEGGTYGVGMPLSVRFNKPVVDRAAVEQRLDLQTSVPVEGSWSWIGERTVTFRPKEYWPAGTQVSVQANLRGVETEPDLFVLEDKGMSFNIGSSFIAVVDAETHTMTVTRDGEVVRTMPITTGKEGWETRSGIKVIMSKVRNIVMDAGTLGVSEDDPEYYRLDVEYALRITTSGEFVHAAPWSVDSHGEENVSHGCVGMSMDNAAWYYSNAKVGDVVQVTNTGRRQNLGNGITVWNESWDSWLAGSAVGQPTA